METHQTCNYKHYQTTEKMECVIYRPISRVVIGREVDYRSRLIYDRYCLTNTTLCL